MVFKKRSAVAQIKRHAKARKVETSECANDSEINCEIFENSESDSRDSVEQEVLSNK